MPGITEKFLKHLNTSKNSENKPYTLIGTATEGRMTKVYVRNRHKVEFIFSCTKLDKGGYLCHHVSVISGAVILR